MALIKINSIVGRNVNVDVTWSNGWQRTFDVPNVPVENFNDAYKALNDYITSMYNGVAAEEALKAYNLAVPAADVLAAVGHTFDDQGVLIS